MGPLAAEIASLRGEVKVNETKIKALEETRYKEQGAKNLIDWFFKNWIGLVGVFLLLAFLLKEWKP